MSYFQQVFDAEEIADGIAEWASIESPSFDTAAVNRMMDHVERTMSAMGAAIERTPGTDQYGDVLRARFHWGDGPGILILGHLDTVHLVGTLSKSLSITRDGDKLFGPGVLDMKGGMYLAVHAISKIIERQVHLGLPVTFMFIPDEEVGSPSTKAPVSYTHLTLPTKA